MPFQFCGFANMVKGGLRLNGTRLQEMPSESFQNTIQSQLTSSFNNTENEAGKSARFNAV
jgi:hypothetical protein